MSNTTVREWSMMFGNDYYQKTIALAIENFTDFKEKAKAKVARKI